MNLEDQIKKIKNKYESVELHEDLKDYIQDSGFIGEMLHHPLVVHVPYAKELNGIINSQYEFKKKKLDEFIKDKKWSSYIHMYERPYRLDAFEEIKDSLTDKEYWSTLKDVFVDSENISQNYETWDFLLNSERDHSEFFMDEDDRLFLEQMPEEIIVYRGFKDEGGEESFSWTLNLEKAIWFAERFGKDDDSSVAKAIINKKDVIGYINSRNEEEILILPENVNVIKIVNSDDIESLNRRIKKLKI